METIVISKPRKIVAWVIAVLLTALYLYSAYGKFMHPEMFEQMHLSSWRLIIATGEIVSALLFLIPGTNIYGAFLLSSLMGGAIIIHMTSGISIMMPSVVLVLVWFVTILRNPELFRI